MVFYYRSILTDLFNLPPFGLKSLGPNPSLTVLAFSSIIAIRQLLGSSFFTIFVNGGGFSSWLSSMLGVLEDTKSSHHLLLFLKEA